MEVVPMRWHKRVLAFSLVAVGLSLTLGAPAEAGCVGLAGTADGFDKQTAVARAQSAVAQAVLDYKAQKRLGAVSVSAMRAKPQPYWRSEVSSNMFFKPDIVNSRSYTVCWTGVVSPYVCTSGAKVCW
jgi:hypothetical protein